ncbi:MAG: hypothetical protein KC427_02860 [Sulfurovum sp.]|uniref:hypothetical protein n=1 Tax=Sulfurovum sp. TaxID=1969726 RepID=UPI0028682F18|nr:hypothetical protein [Sulfurovum sp.]MCO4844938.1 hypothetical protein [Sulfurovum sp.]
MLKKLLTVLLSTVFLFSVVEAKESAKKKAPKKEVYQAVWEKTYGGDDGDIVNGIVALENAEYALVGTCKSFDAQGTDMCVVRMNAKGEIKWHILLGGKKKDVAKAIIRAEDGSLIVLGTSKSFAKRYDRDIYVAKVSLEGKLIWEQNLGGKRDEYAGGIAATDDGGFLVVGDSNSYGNGYKDVYIAKLDQNGKEISSHVIGGEKEDSAQALTRTSDGAMMLVGYRELDRSGNTDFFVMKLDQNGNKIWAKTYGEEQADRLNGVTASADGGIVATGSTRSYKSAQTDMSVMKLDTEGNIVWHKIYGFKYYEYGNAVASIGAGGVMVAGGTSTLGKGDHSAYMIALDKSGKLIWSHVYGDRNKDRMNAIARMDDGSMVAAGGSDSYSRATKFYMLKLDKQ